MMSHLVPAETLAAKPLHIAEWRPLAANTAGDTQFGLPPIETVVVITAAAGVVQNPEPSDKRHTNVYPQSLSVEQGAPARPPTIIEEVSDGVVD
jgi:hypothetical protein